MPRPFHVRACDALIHGAAPLVPGDLRRDWLREWHAEVAYRSRRDEGWSLVVRALGAFAHAAWLRWDRWRLEMLLQDVRYALRTLIRKPGFAVVTVMTLALGIGANATIFSAVRAVLLRPLPFPEPERLIQVSATSVRNPNAVGGTASPPEFVDWRRDSRSFAEMAAISPGAYALTGQGAAEQLTGANVTGGFFGVLSVPALYGRTLTLDDEKTGAEDVVVIGHGLWSRRFGAQPDLVGRAIRLEGTTYRVVGVMPRGFAYPLRAEVWIPLRFTERDLATQRGAHYLDVIARLRSGVSPAQAREDMDAIALRLAAAYPDTNRNSRVALHVLRDALVGDVRPALLMLLGAVASCC